MNNFDDYPTINIVELAYQILDLHGKASQLEDMTAQRDHWRDECFKSYDSSLKSSKETIGLILTAALDPDSVINKGHQKIIEEAREVK
jgi:hypothetical protein